MTVGLGVADATLRVFDFGGDEVKTLDLSGQAPPNGALLLGLCAVDELAPERAQVFALLDLRVEGHHFRNKHVFTTWKSCELPRAGADYSEGSGCWTFSGDGEGRRSGLLSEP